MTRFLENVTLIADTEVELINEFVDYVQAYFNTEWDRWEDDGGAPPVEQWSRECLEAFVSTREV